MLTSAHPSLDLLAKELRQASSTQQARLFLKTQQRRTFQKAQVQDLILLVLGAPVHPDRLQLYEWLVGFLKEDELQELCKQVPRSQSPHQYILRLLDQFGPRKWILSLIQQVASSGKYKSVGILLKLIGDRPSSPNLLQFYYGFIAGLLTSNSTFKLKVKGLAFDYSSCRPLFYPSIATFINDYKTLIAHSVQTARASETCCACGRQQECLIIAVGQQGLALCRCFPRLKGSNYDLLLNFVPFLKPEYHAYWTDEQLPKVDPQNCSIVIKMLALQHPEYPLRLLLNQAVKVIVLLSQTQPKALKLASSFGDLFGFKQFLEAKQLLLEIAVEQGRLGNIAQLLQKTDSELSQLQLNSLLQRFASEQIEKSGALDLFELALRQSSCGLSVKARIVRQLMSQESSKLMKRSRSIVGQHLFVEQGLPTLLSLLESEQQQAIQDLAQLFKKQRECAAFLKQLFATVQQKSDCNLQRHHGFLLFLRHVATTEQPQLHKILRRQLFELLSGIDQTRKQDEQGHLYHVCCQAISQIICSCKGLSSKQLDKLQEYHLPKFKASYQTQKQLFCRGSLQIYTTLLSRLCLIEQAAGLFEQCIKLVIFREKTGSCEQSFLRALFVIEALLARSSEALFLQRILFTYDKLVAIASNATISHQAIGRGLTAFWTYNPQICSNSSDFVQEVAKSRKPLLINQFCKWFSEFYDRIQGRKDYCQRVAFVANSFCRTLLFQVMRQANRCIRQSVLGLVSKSIGLGFISVLQSGRVYFAFLLDADKSVRESAVKYLSSFILTSPQQLLLNLKEKLQFMTAQQQSGLNYELWTRLVSQHSVLQDKLVQIVPLVKLETDRKIMKLLISAVQGCKKENRLGNQLALLVKYSGSSEFENVACIKQRLSSLSLKQVEIKEIKVTKATKRVARTVRANSGEDSKNKSAVALNAGSPIEKEPEAVNHRYELRSRKRIAI